jgi:hypothetical protein
MRVGAPHFPAFACPELSRRVVPQSIMVLFSTGWILTKNLCTTPVLSRDRKDIMEKIKEFNSRE